MNEYLIATHSLPEHTVAALGTMLKSIEPMVGGRWTLRASMPADVLIAPYETLARLPQVLRPGKLPLFIAIGSADEALPISCANLPRPITLPELTAALRRAAQRVDQVRMAQSELSTVPLLETFGAGRQKFSPQAMDAQQRTTLRAAVFRLFQSPIAATLVDEQRQTLFSLLPGVGYSTRLSPAQLAHSLRANPPSLLLELSDVEQRLLSQARHFSPMAELEWIFWITARAPWLRPELPANAAYRLSRWPDFVRLAHTSVEVQLASLLMSQALTPAALQAASGVSQERVLNFLNGAYALRLIAVASDAQAPQAGSTHAKAPAGVASLLAQVRRKFGFGDPENPQP